MNTDETDTPKPPPPAWRQSNQTPSLPEVHRTLPVTKTPGFWRKLLAFSGPGYLVAVGYMDPGSGVAVLAGSVIASVPPATGDRSRAPDESQRPWPGMTRRF